MIARTWRGWAPAQTADLYEEHYHATVVPHLRRTTRFRSARLLRQDRGEEVEFTSIVVFDDLQAVEAFAGTTSATPWSRRQPD